MVGEIRDLEAADIAIKAAQTGHAGDVHPTPTTPPRRSPGCWHGRGAVQHRLQRDPDHRPAAVPAPVRELQTARRLSQEALLQAGYQESEAGRHLEAPTVRWAAVPATTATRAGWGCTAG